MEGGEEARKEVWSGWGGRGNGQQGGKGEERRVEIRRGEERVTEIGETGKRKGRRVERKEEERKGEDWK